MENYQELALRTLSDNSPTYEDYIDATDFDRDTFGYVVCAAKLEQYKKTLAYGKNLPRFATINPIRAKNMNILHAKLGIAGESGEVFDAEGREEVKNEVGDLLWYIAVLLKEYDLDFPEVMQGNIDKLNKRYQSGQFTREEALNRPIG